MKEIATIIKEFKELKSYLETMNFEEVLENFSTFTENDTWAEIDVDDDEHSIFGVFVDANPNINANVSVRATDVTIYDDEKCDTKVIDLTPYL